MSFITQEWTLWEEHFKESTALDVLYGLVYVVFFLKIWYWHYVVTGVIQLTHLCFAEVASDVLIVRHLEKIKS